MGKADDIVSRANWQAHRARMTDILVDGHITLLELAWMDTQKKFPLIGDFTLKNPRVADTIKTLGKRIGPIAGTTQSDIRGILETALTGDGPIPSTDAIARLIRESGANVSVSRSELIARTETGNAMNVGAVLGYREAGVEKVEVLDGDGDEICAEADGQTWTLDEAEANPLGHPGCTRAFIAVVGD